MRPAVNDSPATSTCLASRRFAAMRQTQKSIPKIMNGMLTVIRGRLSSVGFILVFYEV